MRSNFTTRPWLSVLVALAVISSFVIAHRGIASPGNIAPDRTFTITDNVNMVLLFASVRNQGGAYVSGLKKGDFQVFDDGKRQVITEFSGADAPVSVGLVVDDSGSMRSKKAEVVVAGLAFAKESNSKDEFFVVNFNNYVVNGLGPHLPFTDNLQKLRAALYYGTPMGQTALYDAVAHALAHLERSHHEARTLIVVSDGGDNVSKATLPEVLSLIQASRATVYTVGLYDEDDKDQQPGVLKKLSRISGGEFFQPKAMNDIIPVFEKIGRDIRSRYTIGYVPPSAVDSSKRIVRAVKVTAVNANGKKLTVRTRTSYTNIPFTELTHDEDERAMNLSQANADANSAAKQ